MIATHQKSYGLGSLQLPVVPPITKGEIPRELK
jgi:hypothetical protein